MINVAIFTDGDWAGSIIDRKSCSGYCTYVGGEPSDLEKQKTRSSFK